MTFLESLEKQFEIDILFACDNGSRSYGLADEHSDYDIRFIFKRRQVKDYISLKKPVEVIDSNQGDMDVHGWDIMKALQLFNQSNPSLFEWLLSPCVYKNEGNFKERLLPLMDQYFSRKALAYHYYHLSLRNIKQFEKSPRSGKKRLKLCVHATRSYLLLRAVIEEPVLSQVSLNVYTLHEQYWTNSIYLQPLYLAKQNNDFDNINLTNYIKAIEQELLPFEDKLQQLQVNDTPQQELNELLWNVLKIV